MRKQIRIFCAFAFAAGIALVIYAGCAPSKPEPVKVGGIGDDVIDPEEWGKVYPLHYESWMKTKDPKPSNQSRYRKGYDKDKVIYDRLSEYPFASLLYNGWGFGIEYNEPRGHYYAVIDQIEIDPSRVKPGGVCLACKNPYHKPLVEKHGLSYLKMPFLESLKMLPEKSRTLGPACYDCHVPSTMDLRTNKPHLDRGLKMIGKTEFSRQDKRTLACAQCHITYYVPRDEKKAVAADVNLPWTGGKWGDISIEGIIKDLTTDYKRIEWKSSVTGFDLPFIRHPEFEMFTRKSVHFAAGATCADCHMPYTRSGAYKISDHDVTSPLKKEMRACIQCHTESSEWLRDQVYAIQDRTSSLLLRAGYATAASAKLFEMANIKMKEGKAVDMNLYNQAKKHYIEAFLRVVFVGAENSNGFHNPSEAMRILGDGLAHANRADTLMRKALAKAGVEVPVDVPLELSKYLTGRGKHKLNFKADQEVKDPFGTQDIFTPRAAKGI